MKLRGKIKSADKEANKKVHCGIKNLTKFSIKLFQIGIFLVFSIYGLYGQQKNFLPENNNDIQQLIDNLNQVFDFEIKGYSYQCPEVDCNEATKYIQILQDTELHLTLLVHWLIKANMGAMAHLVSLHEQGTITNENLAKAQWALGVEEFLHDLGSMLLDISSLSLSLKDVLDNPSKLRSYKKKDLFDNIDMIYEAGKDYESLEATKRESLLEGQTGYEAEMPKLIGGLTPDILGIDSETLNDYKSHASDLKTIIEECYDKGKDFGKGLKGMKGRGAIGQILGRFAKAYSQAEIEERKKHINSLIVNIAKEDATQSGFVPELTKISTRRYKAEDALDSLKKVAFDWGGNRGLWKLFKDACKNRKKITYGPYRNNKIPDYVYPENLTLKKIMITNYSGYGKALLYLNKQLPRLSERLLKIPAISENIIPKLILSKTNVIPDEEINVKFEACRNYDKSANIKIVPAGTPYGENDKNALVGLFKDLSRTSSYHIYGNTKGEVSFKSPNKPGEYEVRLFKSQSSEDVVASALFKVTTSIVPKCPDIETGNARVNIRQPRGFVVDFANGNYDQVNPSFDIWIYIKNLSSNKYYLTSVPKEYSRNYPGLWLVEGLNYKGKQGSKCKFGVILANSCASSELRKSSGGLSALPKGTKIMQEIDVTYEGETELPDNNISSTSEKISGSLEGWLGRWTTKRGPINIRLEGGRLVIDLLPGGVLTRYEGKIEVTNATGIQIHGTWSTEFKKGTFTWNLKGREFDGLFGDNIGDPETRPWDGIKND